MVGRIFRSFFFTLLRFSVMLPLVVSQAALAKTNNSKSLGISVLFTNASVVVGIFSHMHNASPS